MEKIKSFFGFDGIVGLVFNLIGGGLTTYAIYLSYQKHEYITSVVAIIVAIIFSIIFISDIKQIIIRSKNSY